MLLFIVGAGVTDVVAAQPLHPTPKQSTFEKDVKPILIRYCYDCHGEKKKGDLDLRVYHDVASVLKDRKTWEKVLHNLETHEMPPEKKTQPSDAQREQVVTWVQSQLFKCDCNHPDPGRVTIRRLNRTEYNNTIRDLVGVDFKPADDFPADDVGYGFDNIGDVLSMPPVLIEKYIRAAGKILDAAILAEDPTLPQTNRFLPAVLDTTAGGGPYKTNWFILNREGKAVASFRFPWDGDYTIRVRAYGEQAGKDRVQMGWRLGTNQVSKVEVAATEDAPEIYEFSTHVKRGREEVGVSFLNNYTNKDAPNPKDRDRNLVIEYVEVVGPFNAAPLVYPPTHKTIFFTSPSPTTTNQTIRTLVGAFAKRAYRRPVSKDEIERLSQLADQVIKDGGTFESGVRLSLQAVLVSPQFLFRGEIQPDPNSPTSVHQIDEFALASRLSYFLWSTTPDQELMDLAEAGKLRRNLDAQVKRMLKHQRSRALVDNFGGQWLFLRNLAQFAPDEEVFPEFDESLRAAMQNETELFIQHIVQEDRSILEFINADYTFVNKRLAQHYGIAGISGEEFQRVSLKGTQRGGLLTQASILTITSNPTRTSPVKRGKWVLDNILGTPPPPPPPNVPELKEGKELKGTLRQRMEQHREEVLCASCHARMDPIGFGFENFNAIGLYRGIDGKEKIDPTGALISGERFSGPAELRSLIVNKRRKEFVHCLSEKLLTYALGRGLDWYDKCSTESVMKAVEKGNCRFSSLVMGVVKSPGFQMRRGEGEPVK